jgi:hypothetical protein
MKNKFIITLAAMACAISLHAATAIGVAGTPGVASYAVNSAVGNASTATATNGVYSSSIAGATTESNIIQINPGSNPHGSLVLQLTASATAASTSNAVFVITSSALPIAITNAATSGVAGSASPRGTFATYTLVLNGTTPVTTNIVLTGSSTPSVANGLNLYLESIQNTHATALLTNYSVVVVQ